MALISPMVPLRYNPDHISDPGAVIAPPYDVITEQGRQLLIERDPHNVIRLILPEGDETTKYQHAADLLAEWIATDVLISEPGEAIYPYSQIFHHPATGESVERRGFIAAIHLEPFSSGIILPHERTLSGPKADRLSLMETTDANLEPIFGIYRDPGASSTARLAKVMASSTPLIHAVDIDGVDHRLWRVDDPAMIEAFGSELAQSVVFIVDGHHRYETALTYRDIRRKANPSLLPDAPVDSIMMFLAPTSDPGLLILPTHRVVHSVDHYDFEALLKSLGQHFDLREIDSIDSIEAELTPHADRPSYALLSGDRIVLATLRDDVPADSIVQAELPKAVRELDVTILHEHILEQLLGISKQAQAEQRNLRYVKSAADARAEAGKPDVQLVVMMNSTRLDQVERVAESGEVMPQKSTYFYPKLASGLLIRELGTKQLSS